MLDVIQNATEHPPACQDLDPRLLDILRNGSGRRSSQQMIIHQGPCDSGVQEMGFSPLINPINGSRFGDESFRPYWDSLLDHGGWFEMTVSFSGIPFGFLIKDEAVVDSDLRKMCREFAA